MGLFDGQEGVSLADRLKKCLMRDRRARDKVKWLFDTSFVHDETTAGVYFTDMMEGLGSDYETSSRVFEEMVLAGFINLGKHELKKMRKRQKKRLKKAKAATGCKKGEMY
jgi:DNA invertase Pin-like site-specific DNA recombinase